MNAEQRRSHGEQRFHVLELLCAIEFMPYFKDHSKQKNSTEISRFSLSDLPLDRYQRVFI